MNTRPLSHYLFIVVTLFIGIVYTCVNFYPDLPVVSVISTKTESNLERSDLEALMSKTPSKVSHGYQLIHDEPNGRYLIAFPSVDQQMIAKDYINSVHKGTYLASPNLKSNYPDWLRYLGASPMKLGLDLRGGVHLTLNVDLEKSNDSASLAQKNMVKKIQSLGADYDSATFEGSKLVLSFADQGLLEEARKIIDSSQFAKISSESGNTLIVQSNAQAELDKTNYIMQRTLESINRRVNELGLSEAVIQRQGLSQINIDLPGIQDIQRAKSIIGNTATLSFHIVSSFNPLKPVNDDDFKISTKDGAQIWLQSESVLTGDAINFAVASNEKGKPIIQINLAGGATEQAFYTATSENKGGNLAIVYQETSTDPITKERTVKKSVLSAPRINQALGSSFIIEGMRSHEEASTLALLLRSGSLAAPIDIVHETTVGPSLGEDNIQKGLFSIAIGFFVIVVFMLSYYRIFGLIANLGLLYNLLLIVTCLSLLDATISLPSMAAIVLTVGMAVDANVLINERIREEIRLGSSLNQSIRLGYDKAFATILDANVTTFIVSIVLYTLGSGMIKGFAITLIIGLVCSMISSVYATRIFTRAIQHRITDLPKAIGI